MSHFISDDLTLLQAQVFLEDAVKVNVQQEVNRNNDGIEAEMNE